MGEVRIGIDVGGTNTDAVTVDPEGTVLARAKLPTTPDPAAGIDRALALVAEGFEDRVGLVGLGTTHALNAILRRRDLRRVAVLRLGAPGTLAVPPLTGWPPDLLAALGDVALVARGGVEVDGRTLPLDPDEVRVFAAAAARGADAIAITGTFSPIDGGQEREAAELVREVSDLPVSLGHEVAGLGLLEREGAAVLNAALGGVLAGVVEGLERSVRRLPGARAFLSQNDGTLMRPSMALEVPVLTIGSGPANSLRGAAALTGRTDALVADVGGTSTDIGALVSGFPRESSAGVTLGGVRTNFRMPDLVSVAVGGGTVIGPGDALGVDSVGRRLTEEALVFGGPTATLTDAAVAAGRASIGEPGRVSGRPDLAPALAEAEARVRDAVDRLRLSAAEVDLVLVGGGSVLLPDRLPGVRSVTRPDHADVANAVGAALAPIAGEADLVADVGPGRRDGEIARCLELARARAVEAGADPGRLETVWVDEVPLAYLDRPMARVRVKVAGPSA